MSPDRSSLVEELDGPYSYPKSMVKPCTPFIPIIGVIIVFTLSILPILMWASCRTPKSSNPTILEGMAEANRVPKLAYSTAAATAWILALD